MLKQGKDHLPKAPGSAFSSAAQGTVYPLCNKGTGLAQCLPGPIQVLFSQAAFQLGGAQHIFLHVLPQGQDFRLLTELHEVPVSSFLQPVMVPLKDSTTLWHISHFSQFCSTSRSLVKTLNRTGLQYFTLWCTTAYWPPSQLCAMISTSRPSCWASFQSTFHISGVRLWPWWIRLPERLDKASLQWKQNKLGLLPLLYKI